MLLRQTLLACAALCVTACSVFAPKFQKPTLSVAKIELKGGNLSQQTFLVTFQVDNPNRRALPVKDVHAELTVEGQVLAGGLTDHPFVVPARGSTQFDMSIRANVALALLKFAIKQSARAESVNYELTGAATLDSVFVHSVPFRQIGVLPLTKSSN